MTRLTTRPVFTRPRAALFAAPIALMGLLSACGQAGAPTNDDIKQVVQTYMQAANRQASDSSLGLFDGPYDPADLSITNSDCAAKANGVYDCAVTAVTKKGTHTAQINFKKVNGDWTIVEN